MKQVTKEEPTSATDASPVNAGQAALLARAEAPKEVAAMLGVAPSELSHWRSGRRVPNAEKRARIASILGINASAWERVIGAPIMPTPSNDDGEGDEGEAPTSDVPATLAQIDQHLNELRRERAVHGVTAEQRARWSAEITRALAVRARLEREENWLEDKIVRAHPTWQRIERAISTTLAAFPDAAIAVERALDALEQRTR